MGTPTATSATRGAAPGHASIPGAAATGRAWVGEVAVPVSAKFMGVLVSVSADRRVARGARRGSRIGTAQAAVGASKSRVFSR